MLRKALMKAVWAGNPLCKCLLEIVKQTLQRLWIQNSVQWCKQCSLSESSSFLKTGLSFFIPFFRSAKVWHSWVSFQMTYCPISSVSYNFKFSNFSHQTAKKVDSICPPVQRINLKSESTFCPQGTGKKKKKKGTPFCKSRDTALNHPCSSYQKLETEACLPLSACSSGTLESHYFNRQVYKKQIQSSFAFFCTSQRNRQIIPSKI